jgi:hypothetical protein
MTITPSQDRARGTPPSPEQRPILAKKGWSTFRKAPAFVASWRSLALTILAVAALAYGWKITRIDLYQLVAGLPNMRHIALGLMQPDVATQTTETTSLSLPMNIGAGAGGNVTSVDGRLRLEPARSAGLGCSPTPLRGSTWLIRATRRGSSTAETTASRLEPTARSSWLSRCQAALPWGPTPCERTS